MANCLDVSVVRFNGIQGNPVGAGFRLADRHIVTCAHVIAEAIGLPLDDCPEMPQTDVYLDFPLVEAGHLLTARPTFWQPAKPDGGGDIAILQLTAKAPADAQPARLLINDDLWDHSFRAFGFPIGHDNGVWASGKMRDRDASGWLHIEDVKPTGYRVERGFSGTPVWDDQLESVVGIVVADKSNHVRH